MQLLLFAVISLIPSAECAAGACESCSCSTEEGRLVLDCSHRKLTEIPQGIPSDVVELILTGNKLETLPPNSFSNLKQMTGLALSFNNLTRIDTDTFAGLEEKLEFLDLNFNPIPYNATGYGESSIRRLSGLTKLLIVTDSCPQSLEEPIISNLTALKELTISVPQNGSLPSYFATLLSLDTLILNTNCTHEREILSNDFDALSGLPIRRLSLRKSNLKRVDPQALLPLNATLRILDFSCNVLRNITSLLVGLQGLPIETLLMDRSIYRFESFSIKKSTLMALSSMNLSVLTFSWNTFLDVHLDNDKVNVSLPYLKYIRLGYNQVFLKVSNMSDLLLVVASVIMNARVIDVNGLLRFYDGLDTVINCDKEDVLFADKKFDWEYDEFLHPPAELPVGDWLAKAIENYENGTLTMPPRMTRAYMSDLGQLFFDLSCREFPWQLNEDNNLRHVDLSFSDIPRVDCVVQGLGALSWLDASNTGLISWVPMFFSNLSAPLLQHVNLGYNRLGDFLGKTSGWAPFNGTFNVTHLDLSYNGIKLLPWDVFKYSPKLLMLNLSSNKMDAWNVSIKNAWHIESLDLSHNSIKEMSPDTLEEFDGIRQHSQSFNINMTNNEFSCYSCNNEKFFTWALDNPSAVTNLTCVDGNERLPVSQQTLFSIKWQCLYLKILLGGISTLAFASLVAAVCQSNKWSIKYLYYKVRRRILGVNSLFTSDHLGVYLSYQHADRERAEKVRVLLTRMGIRNFFSHEMLQPGGSVYGQIAHHLDCCTIVVLLVSPDGITDAVSDFEFHMALEKGVSNIVLVLTAEDVPIAKMPRTLRRLLNMNSYLKWPQEEKNHCTTAQNCSLHRSFDKFNVVLEAVVGNIISRTLPSSRIPQPMPDDLQSSVSGPVNEDCENRALMTQWFSER